MPTLILQNKSLFAWLFHHTPDYDFLRTFRCLCFPFLHPYHSHKLDFSSSPCVFLGYSSFHLGYRCLNITSQCIYVSRHIHFHENVFSFANSEQIAQQSFTSSQHTHLPTLNPSLNFHPTAPLIHQTSSSNRPPAAPIPLYYSPTMSATILLPPSPAPLSLSACFYNDHCAGTSSPPLELHVSNSATTEKPESATGSPLSIVVQFVPSTDSPANLQLWVDLSFKSSPAAYGFRFFSPSTHRSLASHGPLSSAAENHIAHNICNYLCCSNFLSSVSSYL